MTIKSWFTKIKDKFTKTEVTTVSWKDIALGPKETRWGEPTPIETTPVEVIPKEGEVRMATDSTMKDKVIAMMIPVLLKLAEKEIPKLINKYLPPEKIDEFIVTGLKKIKAKVAETKTEWDDVLIIPLIQLAEEVFGVSAEVELDNPVSEESEKDLTDKLIETVVDSITT